jgi:membrane protein implicated in regulation of membrane protease activity
VGDYDWVWWIGLAVVLGLVEVSTLSLVFAMLSAGALAGAVTALATDNVVIQALAAMFVAIAMLAAVRPIALRHLKTPAAVRTGVAALVGAQGVVVEQVDAHNGRVRLKGEIWSARAYDPSHTIAAGRNVEVMQIDGATAVVYESEI